MSQEEVVRMLEGMLENVTRHLVSINQNIAEMEERK